MTTSKGLSTPVVRVVLGVAFVLSLPLVAMLITDDVVWSLADFVTADILLAAIGVVLEPAARENRESRRRARHRRRRCRRGRLGGSR